MFINVVVIGLFLSKIEKVCLNPINQFCNSKANFLLHLISLKLQLSKANFSLYLIIQKLQLKQLSKANFS